MEKIIDEIKIEERIKADIERAEKVEKDLRELAESYEKLIARAKEILGKE
jgi:F0F1-type ATP synthase membrane subunit b/b'